MFHFPLTDKGKEEDILEFMNYDLTSTVTLVDVNRFKGLLQEAGYEEKKIDYLYQGFTNGFNIHYREPLNKKGVRRQAPNLKLRVGNETELWNKVMNEVKLGRYARPFDDPPFDSYVQLPIGLVPKDKGKKTRLIFHLSYPKDGDSINSGIPKELCTVKYPDFDSAVKWCLQASRSCSAGKSDMSAAFRQVPLLVSQFCLMVMKALHPISRKFQFFVDKCLPFGSSISCAIFQAISDAIAFVVKY